jgi:hypothetical protein
MDLASPAQLRRRCRLHACEHLYDESGSDPVGWAIYALSDPRDLREVRYVGQTTSPRRRFLQHLNHAQLWLPSRTDALPWWIREPKLRPLYSWIRKLYADGDRLPVMLVGSWQISIGHARHAERAKIYHYLSRGRQLLNVESEILGDQISLI